MQILLFIDNLPIFFDPISNTGVNFIFLRKKGDFLDVFSAFYGQRSVTAAWATRSPWSISALFIDTHIGYPKSHKATALFQP